MTATLTQPGGVRWSKERWLKLRPYVVDGLIAIAITVPMLLVHSNPQLPKVRHPLLGFVFVLVQNASLILRRRYPLLVWAAAQLGIWAAVGWGFDVFGAFAPAVAAYTVAAYRPPKISLFVIAAAFVPAFIPPNIDVWGALTSVPFAGGIWLLGFVVRERRLSTARHMEERAQQAVVDERARIARELHDVVAHHVSLMVIQAEAAQHTKDEAQRVEAVENVAAMGRSALNDLRRLLGVLRPDVDPNAVDTAPGIGELPTLVAEMERAGVDVELAVDATHVPRSLELTIYRLVQEALTNVVKHAGRVHVRVRVQEVDDRVIVEVRDQGRGDGEAQLSDVGAGRGLAGMRERVAVFGGEFSAGPTPEGGFAVRASLPIAEGDASA